MHEIIIRENDNLKDTFKIDENNVVVIEQVVKMGGFNFKSNKVYLTNNEVEQIYLLYKEGKKWTD